MNITDLLKEDHREVENLMSQLESEANQETFDSLKIALTIHTKIEEEIFYPALVEFEESEDLIDEAYQEHNEVEQILEEMSVTQINGDDFQALLLQLNISINHHVQEEENRIFPIAETLLEIETLEEMADNAQDLKSDVGLMEFSTI